ncbi:hypothetical protein HY483_02565 [Candidatus Woesearchaeota archaeon]|nr:hypothetical protein [Candidatus Woesearchaeota archaeon]
MFFEILRPLPEESGKGAKDYKNPKNQPKQPPRPLFLEMGSRSLQSGIQRRFKLFLEGARQPYKKPSWDSIGVLPMIIFSSAKGMKRLMAFPELREFSLNYFQAKKPFKTAQENEPKITQLSLNKWS